MGEERIMTPQELYEKLATDPSMNSPLELLVDCRTSADGSTGSPRGTPLEPCDADEVIHILTKHGWVLITRQDLPPGKARFVALTFRRD